MNEISKNFDDKISEEETQVTIPELVANIEAMDRNWALGVIDDPQQAKEWMEERCKLRKELYTRSTPTERAQSLVVTFEEERKNYKWQKRRLGFVPFNQIMIDVWGCVPEYESLSDEEKAAVDSIKKKNRWIE